MGLGALVGQYQAVMNQVTQFTVATAQLGMQTALYTAAMSYQTALIESEGVQAQLQMDQIAAAANVVADAGNLAMRNAMGMASKAQEMSLFIAQYREKMLNLSIQIAESKADNTWSRIKRAAQGFKF